jgi:hypothetical protein
MAQFNLLDMLGGGVQRREAPTQDSSLGQLLGFLSQGQTQAPQMQQQGGGPVDTSLIHLLMQEHDRQKEQDYADEGAQLRQKLMGSPGEDRVPTPLLGAHDAVKGSGYLGGELSPKDVMAGLLGSKDKTTSAAGLAMLNDQFAPRTPVAPHYMEMGVPGKEGYRVNAVMGPNGPQAIGEPWKPSSGVTVNTGENGTQRVLTPKEKEDYGFTASSVVGVDHKGEMKVIQQPTEAQGKDAGRHGMQQTFDKQYSNLISEGYNPTEVTKDRFLQPGLDMSGYIGPAVATAARQNMDPKAVRYNQIMDSWVETFGRDVSGGAITPPEYPTWRKMYWPQQGDSPEAVLEKTERRKAYEQSLNSRSGETSIHAKPEVIPALSPDSGKEIEAEMRRRGLLK